MKELDFAHRFVPGKGLPSSRTLLLLHGTGGDENDLLDLGHVIDPDARLLSPRGKVSENGAPRFFRRLAQGVFDEEDVVRRAHELAEFVEAAGEYYGLDLNRMVAVGYSNGANIAAAMMLLGIARFTQAVLLRAMVPLSNIELKPELNGSRILILAGKFDPIAGADLAGTLAGLFRGCGADATLQILPTGHELTSLDVSVIRKWLGTE